MPAAEEPASPWEKETKSASGNAWRLWQRTAGRNNTAQSHSWGDIKEANYLPNNGCNFATAARKIMGEKPNRGLPDFSKKCAQIGRQAWELGIVSLFSHCQSAAAKPVVTWNSARTKPHRHTARPPQAGLRARDGFFSSIVIQRCKPCPMDYITCGAYTKNMHKTRGQ